MQILRYTYTSNSLFLQVLGDVVLVLLSPLLVVGSSADKEHHCLFNLCNIKKLLFIGTIIYIYIYIYTHMVYNRA